MPSKISKKVLEALALAGIDPDDVKDEFRQEHMQLQERERRSFHAEATLMFLQYPMLAREAKKCKHCGETFLTNYHGVAYCDDPCRKAALKGYGIGWESKTNVERYGGYQPPFIVPPAALQAMQQLLNSAGLGNQDQSVDPIPVFSDDLPIQSLPENDEPDDPETNDDSRLEQSSDQDDFLKALSEFG